MEIADSARKHGVADSDMLYAVRMPLRWFQQGDDRVFIIGPDLTGRLLEVVVLDPETEPVIIHAMVLRPKFYDSLKRGDDHGADS